MYCNWHPTKAGFRSYVVLYNGQGDVVYGDETAIEILNHFYAEPGALLLSASGDHYRANVALIERVFSEEPRLLINETDFRNGQLAPFYSIEKKAINNQGQAMILLVVNKLAQSPDKDNLVCVEQMLDFTLEDNRQATWYWDLKDGTVLVSKMLKQLLSGGVIRNINDFAQYMEKDEFDFVFASILEKINSSDTFGFEHQMNNYIGQKFKVFHRGKVLVRDKNGKPLSVVSLISEIDHDADYDANNHLIFYDSLTGLANRRLFENRINYAALLCKKRKAYGYLMFLDLDNFKPINDQYGHSVGDYLLQGFSKRIQVITKSTDTVTRYGGDEFLILSGAPLDSGEQARLKAFEIASKIQEKMVSPFVFNQRNFVLKVSIGIAVFGGDVVNPHTIIDNADQAMIEAKKKGGNTIQFLQSVS